LQFLPVYRCSTSSRTGRVPSLNHKVLTRAQSQRPEYAISEVISSSQG
jgi:hypothetical protein